MYTRAIARIHRQGSYMELSITLGIKMVKKTNYYKNLG